MDREREKDTMMERVRQRERHRGRETMERNR